MSDLLPSPESLILVAVITDPRDLEIARVLGWYRIPLRSAPRVISVDYLAFYQTSAFGDSRWQIQYIATVRGHELTSRVELLRDEPDHPHAAQEYYKIQLGPLFYLPKPIHAEHWHRITFFYTTGDLLLHASKIEDLIVPSDERGILWQALQERALKSQNYQALDQPPPDFDPILLADLLGIGEFVASYQPNENL